MLQSIYQRARIPPYAAIVLARQKGNNTGNEPTIFRSGLYKTFTNPLADTY